MDPITGAAIVGSVMSFKGQRAAGKAAQQAAEYNAQVAENEAILLARRKRAEEEVKRMQTRQLIGSQRVATAASGIQMSGSPLGALADSYFALERDVANLQYASSIEQTRATSTADMARFEGDSAKMTSDINSYATLLGGTTTAAINYDKMSGGKLAKRYYG